MMKKYILWMSVVALIAGCSFYGKENVELMLDNPPGVLEDSLYADTQDRLEKLESRYLNQEISYAEYTEKKQELEDFYKREADRRSSIIQGNQ